MVRSWEVYSGRKKSIMLKMHYSIIDESYLWTWNKKWLKGFLDSKLITNLEYLEGIKLLKEVQREGKNPSHKKLPL
jgi:hypothetical protein